MEGKTLTCMLNSSTASPCDFLTTFCKVRYDITCCPSTEFISPTSHIFSNYFIWVISLEVKGHLHNILSHGASYKVLHNLYPLHWYVYKCSDLIRVHSIHHELQKAWLSPSCPRPTSNPPASSEASIIRKWPLSPPPSPPLFKPPSSLDWPQQ